MIPYGRQDIRQADIDAIKDVLNSDFLTQGPCVPQFEASLMAKTGAAYGVAVSNATAALHIACLALGLGRDDVLWTSPVTFVASANCGLYCGADVDFVDIDPISFNMCPVALEQKLIVAQAAGRLPKIVVPVHLCGQSADMKAIHALSEKFGFRIIEDASHAVGGAYDGAPIGDCRYSDITIFSFHPVKIITTAEGGMAMTNSADLAHKMGLLRSHGITRDPAYMDGPSDGPWYYQQVDLGLNYRMTELQAALGVSQADRLEEYIAARTARAALYDTALADLPLRTQGHREGGASAWHLYVIQLEDATRHKEIFEGLRQAGVGVNVHYIPVHLQPWYKARGFQAGDFPVAEDYYSRAISIPLFATMTDTQQTDVITALKSLLHRA